MEIEQNNYHLTTCNHSLCEGVSTDIQLSDGILSHVLPCEVDVNQVSPVHVKEIRRDKKCLILHYDSTLNCPVCRETIRKEEKKKIKRFKLNITTPAKPNAPLSKTHPENMKLALINERLKCSQFEKDISRMKNEINLSGIAIPSDLSTDFINIMNENQSKCTPLLNCFGSNKEKHLKKILKVCAITQ